MTQIHTIKITRQIYFNKKFRVAVNDVKYKIFPGEIKDKYANVVDLKKFQISAKNIYRGKYF